MDQPFDALSDDLTACVSYLTEVMNDFQLLLYKVSAQTDEIDGEVNPLMN